MNLARIRTRLAVRVAIIGAPTLALCCPAFGQTPASEQSSTALQEVIVTAQRREQSIQDTSVAVTALTGEQLLDKGIGDFGDLGKIAPGFQLTQASAYIKTSMRGSSDTETINSPSPTVAFYMDGNYLFHPSQAHVGFVDVERVEVLRGPQGTLFGRNAFGGLVQVITREPTEQFDAGFDTTVGNYSRERIEGFVNLPVSDQLFFRLSGVTEQRDGYLENVANPQNDLYDVDMKYLRGKLRWEPNERVDVTLSADYWEDGANGLGDFGHNVIGIPVDPATNLTNGITGVLLPRLGQDPTGATPGGRFAAGYTGILSDPYSVQSGTASGRDLEQSGVYGVVNWDMGFATAKLQLGFVDYSEFWTTDGDLSPLDSTLQGVSLDSEVTTQEIQFASPAGESSRFDWVVGAYFHQEDVTEVFFQNYLNTCCVNNAPDENSPDGNMTFNPFIYGLRTDSMAGFAQGTFSLTDRFRAIAGVRYTSEERKLLGRTTTTLAISPDDWRNMDSLSFETPILNEDSNTFDEPTWKAGFEVDLTDDSLLYAHASTGFLAGGYNAVPASNIPPSFDEQTITSYEIGSKNMFLDGALAINVALYTNETDDLVAFSLVDVAGVSFAVRTNAGKTKTTGVELEVDWAAGPNTHLGLRAAYMDAKYDSEFLILNPFQAGEDFIQDGVRLFDNNGRRVQQSPDFTLGLTGSHDFSLGARGTITPSIDFYYSTDYQANPLPYFFAEQDAYTRTDVNVDWRSADDRWGVSVFVRNLEDDTVITNAERYGGHVAALTLAPPRTYGVRVSYRH